MFDEAFERLPATAFSTERLSRGERLFHQGQRARGLYRVESGTLVLQRTGLDGRELTVHRATSGNYLAEGSVFSPCYHCDAVCTDAARVTRIAKQAVLSLMSTDPVFARAFAAGLAAQVQSARQQIEILAIRSAPERVLAAIRAGYLQGSVRDFARRIHLSDEASYRTLSALCRAGWLLRVGRGRYELVAEGRSPSA